MIYTYRVTLEGIKGFFRIYKISGEHSLYTFHKQLRADLEFPMDQPILFKAFDSEGAVAARYALVDLGSGTVDAVTVDATVKAGVTKFVYFYDTISKKSVTITLEAEEPGTMMPPTVVETKGPNPIEFENGYVAFEDLPEQRRHLPGEFSAGDEDDDDEDDDVDDEEDDEDEDEEKEDLIYDENES